MKPTVRYVVWGGGLKDGRRVWLVMRDDGLNAFQVANAPTREQARALARRLADTARLGGDSA